MRGVIIAAPNSGAGKTTLTLGLLRALRSQGIDVAAAKSGPDYIDPQFHTAASGRPSVNLDAWAMSPQTLKGLASGQSGELLVIEGAMGLFDGAPDTDDPLGKGSVADLAAILKLPVVLVIDVARQSQTVAAIVQGMATLRADVTIAAVILNNVGSARHGAMIKRALAPSGIPVIGMVPRTPDMQLESRHLGLVQAIENPDLDAFIKRVATHVKEHIDIAAFCNLAAELQPQTAADCLPPLGQKIAIARDVAFAFAYPHLLTAWQNAGAELQFFSPLNDEGPGDADAVYLPGGYPELHAGTLTNARNFREKMIAARDNNSLIYGECGGYMVLGDALIDADSARHEMLGLLPVVTSFANRKLHLGYRQLRTAGGLPWADKLFGHEFHYATTISRAGEPLFRATDALGNARPDMGVRKANVMGSFAHVIG